MKAKKGKNKPFSYDRPQESECIKAKGTSVTVKFKNLVETANAVRGMSIKRAEAYLKNVLDHKEVVPFRKFKSGIGRCAQAKQFGTNNGRWPRNAAICMKGLLRNAMANAEFYGKDPTEYYIWHIQVNQAPVTVRKTFRAHGRINPYERHPSHIQIVLKELDHNQ